MKKDTKRALVFIEKNTKSKDDFRVENGEVRLGEFMVEVESSTHYKVISYESKKHGSVIRTYECYTSGWKNNREMFANIKKDLIEIFD